MRRAASPAEPASHGHGCAIDVLAEPTIRSTKKPRLATMAAGAGLSTPPGSRSHSTKTWNVSARSTLQSAASHASPAPTARVKSHAPTMATVAEAAPSPIR